MPWTLVPEEAGYKSLNTLACGVNYLDVWLTEHYSIHQDIKPDNILVALNPSSPSEFDCKFKLVDLGLTYFQSVSEQKAKSRIKDARGTQLFSEFPIQRIHAWLIDCRCTRMFSRRTRPISRTQSRDSQAKQGYLVFGMRFQSCAGLVRPWGEQSQRIPGPTHCCNR
jgi:serine/threonine protein kinase